LFHLRSSYIFLAIALANLWINPANANADKIMCYGNIEDGFKRIITPGISYKLSYIISGSNVRVQFAGHEFDANIDSAGGKAWKGIWIRSSNEDIYFSYLPDEGGIIKFKYKDNNWYSGNC
jgi:hypothetical protein